MGVQVPPRTLIKALFAPVVTRRLIERYVLTQPPEAAAPSDIGTLSDREIEVLRHIALGHSNAEIASRLHISQTTVKTHVASILRKLDLRDRVQAIVYAYETGLCQPARRPHGD